MNVKEKYLQFYNRCRKLIRDLEVKIRIEDEKDPSRSYLHVSRKYLEAEIEKLKYAASWALNKYNGTES